MGKKLSNLTKVTTASDTTLFYLVDPARAEGDQSVGMDKDDVATLVGGGGGAALPIAKTGTTIVFTEDAEYYADVSLNPIESGNIVIDTTDAVVGVTVNVSLKGYEPSISGSDYIILSDTSNQRRDVYSFYNANDGIKLNKIGESTLTTPVLSLLPSSEEVAVSWSTSVGATSYTLKRNTVDDFDTATTIYTGALLTFTDTGLTDDTLYYYYIEATGGTGSYDSLVGTGSATPTTPATDFTTSLVMAFDFEDNLNDYTTVNDGVAAYGAITYNAGGLIGKAIETTGAGMRVDWNPGDLDWSGNKSWSISMWVYREVLTSTDYLLIQNGLEIFGSTLTGIHTIEINGTGGGVINSTIPTADFTQNAWTNLVITFDGTSDLKTYINGVETGTYGTTGTYTDFNYSIFDSAWGAKYGSQEYNGRMDAVRVWVNRILTPSEITELNTLEGAGTSILP